MNVSLRRSAKDAHENRGRDSNIVIGNLDIEMRGIDRNSGRAPSSIGYAIAIKSGKVVVAKVMKSALALLEALPIVTELQAVPFVASSATANSQSNESLYPH